MTLSKFAMKNARALLLAHFALVFNIMLKAREVCHSGREVFIRMMKVGGSWSRRLRFPTIGSHR
jgi:hypothetical protein